MDDEGRWELLETVASAGGDRALASFRTPLDVEEKDGPLARRWTSRRRTDPSTR